MSFIDLATLAMHRRNEMEARINTFIQKCDHAITDINKLKLRAQGFVQQLNCEPSELKDRFLNCMKQLDEFNYLITDFNLATQRLDDSGSIEHTPVHDTSSKCLLPTPAFQGYNLMDVLSEPTPSTSAACSNNCPTVKQKRKKVPKEDQLLITFSSASCSSESIPEVRKVEKQVEVTNQMKNLSLKDESPPPQETYNLPAQAVLQTEHVYPATIMNIDGGSFWVITDDIDEVYSLMIEMTKYYKKSRMELSTTDVVSLTYCAYYDEESDCYYRGLVIRLTEESTNKVEVFLVDTGELRDAELDHVQPLVKRFYAKPPYARCCHLAGIDLLSCHNKELMERQEAFLKEYIGTHCTIQVDDNTSESLGVYVILPTKENLNDILVHEELGVSIDNPTSPAANATSVQGPPELRDHELDITECPEYEDPVEAVTGYSNRDEAELCKHYKGGPEKTCFKGARCKKRHVLMHPEGWTLDRVEVPAKYRSVPLPAPGTWHKVHVTYVCHFNRLYVQFVKEKQKEEIPSFGVVLPPTSLTRLVSDMNSPAACMAYKPLKMAPAPGELVAALYPLDNQWYRARVLSVTRADQNVEIMYLDYGNVVWVKEDAIRVLDAKYLALPAQALRCRLAGAGSLSQCSRQWADAKKKLASIVLDRTLNAHVIDREYDELVVELYDEEQYNVVEQLAALGAVQLQEYQVGDDARLAHKVVVP